MFRDTWAMAIVPPDSGERLLRGERSHRVLAELPELEAVELWFGPGFVVEPHVHEDHADSFFVLEGTCEFTYEERTVVGRPGTWVSVPRGTRHGFRNAGDGDLRLLNVHAPCVGFVDELREP
jgi:quercetin dioxygenase-like cupin family protein